MILRFNGRNPVNDCVYLGVKDDNEVESLTFKLDYVQGDINLAGWNAYLKYQNMNGTYADKIKLAVVGENELLSLTYVVPKSVTYWKKILMQLSFENSLGQIWQTKMFNVYFSDTLEVDKKIGELYPEVLTDLENRVDRIEKTDYILNYTTHLDFPEIGQAGRLYIDDSENCTYRWDPDELKYYCVGDGLENEIIINGGTLKNGN